MATQQNYTCGSYIPPVLLTGDVEKIKQEAINEATKYAVDYEMRRFIRFAGFESPEAARKRREQAERINKILTISNFVISALALCTVVAGVIIGTGPWGYLLVYLLLLFTAPYTVWQRRMLNRTPGLREAANLIRMEADKVGFQVNKLQKENDALEQQVQRLRDIEAPLIKLVEEQGHNVDEVRLLARQNRSTLREMKKLQETEVVQQIITAIINSDESGDFVISESEMQDLILRLMNIPNISVDEAEIRAAVATASSHNLTSLFKLTATLMGKEDLELSKKDLPVLTHRDLQV